MRTSTTTDQIDFLARSLLRQHGVVLGKYRGKVTQVGTGEHLGQIKAVIPSLFGATETVWIDPVVPFAGTRYGFAFLPEVDDGVWIEFEEGDSSRPLWSGFFWGRDQMPAAATDRVRVLATKHGHQVVLDDERDELRLEHGRGPSIVIDEEKITLRVGGKTLVLDEHGLTVNDGALEVT
ncbi:MAG: phage baseplate assembly protein V [Kofleriaceae bacterium]